MLSQPSVFKLSQSALLLTLHNTAQCIQYSLRGEVLGRNQIDEVLLALLLLLDDVEDGGIGFLEVGGQQLKKTLALDGLMH